MIDLVNTDLQELIQCRKDRNRLYDELLQAEMKLLQMEEKSMRLGVKRLSENATPPQYAKAGDSGFDLAAAERKVIEPGSHALVKTDLAFEIPEGFEIQVRSRSGLGTKGIQAHFGTVDAGYRGNVGVILYNHGKFPMQIEIGDRIAQGVLAPVTRAEIFEVTELSETERGASGYGSTGI